MKQGKLELTWVGKDDRPRLEPRVLVEAPAKAYGDPKSENMLVFGDNLLALKALEQDFTERIKCIYIDPPYNTGSAFSHYDDGLEHSIWLSMLRDRLEMLKTLLSSDGSMWISIDDVESHYLKVLCDELFGRRNFVTNVMWQKKYAPQSNIKWISESHEHVLVYAKDKSTWEANLIPRSAKMLKAYKNPDKDPRGLYKADNFTTSLTGGQRGAQFARTGICANLYEIVTPSGRRVLPPKGTCWRYSEERYQELLRDNRVYFGPDGNNVPAYKRFLSEVQDGVRCQSVWLRDDVGDNQEGKREVTEFNRESIFSTPKPERLIQRVLHLGSNPGDWVLDSFAGSGTTGAVAHKMGRKWIMVELGEHCHTHIIPRMKKVIDGTDQGGISEAVGWKGGGGFKYYRLAESLLVRDKELSTKDHPVFVINPRYDETLLIRGICKLAGFKYRKDGRLHGISSENRFLHVTTRLVTQMYLDSLGEDIGKNQSLVIYCTRRVGKITVPDNVEIRKIPRDLLEKCDFEEDK